MKTIYAAYCKVKDYLAMALLCIISSMVFLSAVARTIKHPLNWAQDVSLLLFAWLVFLGADLVLRREDFISLEILTRYFPKKLRNVLYYLWNVMAIVFLGVLARFGVPLCFQNSKRLFQTLGISYSWATASVPIGSAMLIITIVVKLHKRIKGETSSAAESKI